ncbi:unnamed protein product [Prunus brigantina]
MPCFAPFDFFSRNASLICSICQVQKSIQSSKEDPMLKRGSKASKRKLQS